MNEFLVGISRNLGKLTKLTLALCMTLPLQTMASEVDGDFVRVIQAGDTIAGMTVTQASIDDVDRLMGDMREAETFYQMVTAQNLALFGIASEFCQRHEPELAQEVENATNEWLNRTNPMIYEKMNEQEKVEVVFDSQNRRHHISELKAQYLSMYLTLESSGNSSQHCPMLIKKLSTNDPSAFVDNILKSYKDL